MSRASRSFYVIQVQAEQALQNITAAMEQASGHRQEAAVLRNQLAADQVTLYIACLSALYLHSGNGSQDWQGPC